MMALFIQNMGPQIILHKYYLFIYLDIEKYIKDTDVSFIYLFLHLLLTKLKKNTDVH